MKIGTKVGFSWPLSSVEGHTESGTGEVVGEIDADRVLVAVDPAQPEGRHFVIACALTWLTQLAPSPHVVD